MYMRINNFFPFAFAHLPRCVAFAKVNEKDNQSTYHVLCFQFLTWTLLIMAISDWGKGCKVTFLDMLIDEMGNVLSAHGRRAPDCQPYFRETRKFGTEFWPSRSHAWAYVQMKDDGFLLLC